MKCCSMCCSSSTVSASGPSSYRLTMYFILCLHQTVSLCSALGFSQLFVPCIRWFRLLPCEYLRSVYCSLRLVSSLACTLYGANVTLYMEMVPSMPCSSIVMVFKVVDSTFKGLRVFGSNVLTSAFDMRADSIICADGLSTNTCCIK